ncbi:MAG: glycosyl transferase, partial [Pleurocapsa sp.]
MNNTKIAWLLPVAWFYWQPTLSEFTKAFPKTTIFTALFPGYTKGYENSLNLEIIGKFKIFRDREKISQSKSGSGFTYLSPKVIQPLLKLKPQIVFTSSFGVWTLLALLFKPLGGWKVVLAYEGSSPGV